MNNHYTLYVKYLYNATEQRPPDTLPFKAPSPFAEGEEIEVDEYGHFTCSGSGKKGNAHDFLKEDNDNLTETGAKVMAKEDNRISSSRVSKAKLHLKKFREDKAQIKIATEKLGISESDLLSIPIYMDDRVSQYYYLETQSESGTPLAVSTFTTEKPLRSLRGVPRIPGELSERVWFVENSLLAHTVKKTMGESAICWPKMDEIHLYDYKKLLKGKTLVFLHGPLYFTYEESYYPFLEIIRSAAASFACVNYASMCSGQSLHEWLKTNINQQRLVAEAERGAMLQPVSREIYKKYVRRDDTRPIAFAQSYARGFFFYGTGCGKVVQSWPVDILEKPMVERNFRVEVIEPEIMGNSIALSTDRVVEITESVLQLTPKNTFRLIRELIRDHIYLENEDMEVVLTLWIMGTYVFTLFNAYPYLHINASKDSGKSTLMELIKSISFNGIMASKITPARLMQEVSDAQTTTCLDEFEKDSGSQGSASTEILNSGYKREGRYMKMRGQNTNAMDLYSPKVFSSVSEIKKDTLASRTLPIIMNKKPKHDSTQSLQVADHKTSQRIREAINGGYALGLYHHYTIEYLMARLPRQISLPCGLAITGRKQELITPLVVLAQLLDINKTAGDDSIEAHLYSALEFMLFPEIEDEVQRLKILANQLREWGEDHENVIFTQKAQKCWISNKMWNDSRLMTHFDNERTTLLNWLKGLNQGIERETLHIPDHGTESCIGFPLDLEINDKLFGDWFNLAVPA